MSNTYEFDSPSVGMFIFLVGGQWDRIALFGLAYAPGSLFEEGEIGPL